MKRKKMMSLFLAVFLALAGTACGVSKLQESDELLTGADEEPEPVTLDWYVHYSWFVTGWGENLVSRTITEETGVDIDFITPLGSASAKLNSLIASDSLPDIITIGWWEPQYQEMIQNGMVYALNELADQYDPGFYDVADAAVLEWCTQEDGNVYGYPNSSYSPEDLEMYDNISSNQTFLVRKDIYEAIGSPDMTTPEGFYEAVAEAARLFPEVNGEPLIPIGAHVFDEGGCDSFVAILQNFLAVPWEDENGNYYDRNTDPEYIRWLKVFRQLGEDGYLADDIFIDSRTQTSEKIAEGRYFCMLYQRTDMADQQKILYQNNPDEIYIAVDGPKNSNGDDPVLPSGGMNGWTMTLISKNCESPDRALSFISYMLSEHGQKLISLGVEGVTYDMIDGKAVLKEEVARLLNTDRESYDAVYGADDTYWMLQDNVMQLAWQPDYQEPLKQLAEWTYPYTRYLGQYEFLLKEGSEAMTAYTNCRKLWGTTLKKLLLAESEDAFDRILQEYIRERDALGYSLVIEEQTRQIQENKQKLGME